MKGVDDEKCTCNVSETGWPKAPCDWIMSFLEREQENGRLLTGSRGQWTATKLIETSIKLSVRDSEPG